MSSDILWVELQPGGFDAAGILPWFLADERPAAEQFDERYQFGGWQPIRGFTMGAHGVLEYPEDPPLEPVLMAHHGDEIIMVYLHAIVAILQKDGSFEAARMD